MSLRAFVLRGSGAAAALELVHVNTDVLGVVETDDSVTIWLDGPLPAIEFRDVVVEELPEHVANATATGLEHDAPIRVADDLLVRPPWVERPADFVGLELVVPRGMAFGSGEHDSTQAALVALHAAWCEPASFADVGTGSGILALYARLRGCPRIEGCDVEEPAVLAARELLPGADIVLGGPEAMPFRADLVIANLTAQEQHAALPAILERWTRKAPLVLSGMRAHEVDGVIARLPAVSSRTTRGAFTALVVPPSA